jgi:hypothetical protein
MLVLVEKLLRDCEVVVLTAVFWTCVFASWTHHMFADSLWSSVSWEIMKWVVFHRYFTAHSEHRRSSCDGYVHI